MEADITEAVKAESAEGQPWKSSEPADRMPPEVPWSAPRKVAFRFVFSYLLLYVFPLSSALHWFWGPILAETPGNPRPKLLLWLATHVVHLIAIYENLWEKVVPWFGAHILHLRNPITVIGQSVDSTYGCVKVFCFVVIAAIATAGWSVLDRNRVSYPKLDQWIRLYVRVVLATTLLSYGADKVIPVQMPPPSLSTLMQPFGDLTPYRLSWSFIGASPAYQIFGGVLEMFGGILLLLPGTATLGALVSLGVLSNVFMLNMCYGIPVKFWALHLLLFACFLLLPATHRLGSFFVLNRRVEPERRTPLFQRRWLNYSVWAIQWALGIWVMVMTFSVAIAYSHRVDSVALTNPLYGIWRVDEFAVDGQLHPPLLTDTQRWQRMIFTSTKALTVQEMNGLFSLYATAFDTHKSVLWLRSINSAGTSSPWWSEYDWKSETYDVSDESWRWRGDTQLSYNRPLPDTITLEGLMNGHRLRVTLKKEDRQFVLKTRGFSWINDEYDFFNEHVDQLNGAP